MTIDHANRDQLYRSAVRALGQEEADTLMASLPPADWTDLARTSDLDARFLFTNTEMDRRFTETNTEMDRRFTETNTEMDRRFNETNTEMDRRFNETNTEMDRRFTEAEQRMDLRFEKIDAQFVALRHETRGDFESALRKHTQWMVGGLGAMAVSMFGVVISILTLG